MGILYDYCRSFAAQALNTSVLHALHSHGPLALSTVFTNDFYSRRPAQE
jgi:hypothetical protein